MWAWLAVGLRRRLEGCAGSVPRFVTARDLSSLCPKFIQNDFSPFAGGIYAVKLFSIATHS